MVSSLLASNILAIESITTLMQCNIIDNTTSKTAVNHPEFTMEQRTAFFKAIDECLDIIRNTRDLKVKELQDEINNKKESC